MHVLAVNSVSTLLNYLSEQLENTPSLADIQGWNKDLVLEDPVIDGNLKEEAPKVRQGKKRNYLKIFCIQIIVYRFTYILQGRQCLKLRFNFVRHPGAQVHKTCTRQPVHALPSTKP